MAAQDIDNIVDRFDTELSSFDDLPERDNDNDEDLLELEERGISTDQLAELAKSAEQSFVLFSGEFTNVIGEASPQEEMARVQTAVAVQNERKRHPFTLSIALPFTYDTNVANDPENGLQAFNVNPSIQLRLADPAGSVRPYVSGRVGIDAFTEHSENDTSSIAGTVGFEIHQGKALARFVPFFEYSVFDLSGDIFGDQIVTAHNFTGGVNRRFRYNRSKRNEGRLDVRLVATRREATVATAERTQVALRLNLRQAIPDGGPWNSTTKTFESKWHWALTQQIEGRFFTNGDNEGRDDVNLRTVASIGYQLSETLTANVGANFIWNISNVAAEEFTAFEIGPRLGLRWTF